MRGLAVLWLFCSAAVQANEAVGICFNYGCAAEETAAFSESRLAWARELLGSAETAERERVLLSLVMGRLYGWAGEQTPIHADRGGNIEDDGERGRMDCIDHSTTSTRLLRMLESRGALRFHRVLEKAHRGWIFEHFSAQIEEIGPPLAGDETEDSRRFAVDSWYVDNGRPAPIIPMELWYRGRGPDG